MSHSSKTWNLAERSRKVSKGQAKIFLTRSAVEEQRLSKLTHNLDKEKAAMESQLSYAQKLLMKRYGAGKVGDGGGSDSRWAARDRSHTYDPTFITKAYEEKDKCPEITGRPRAASGSSCDLDDRKLSGSTRGLSDIPRVLSQGNVSTGKDKDNVSASKKISLSVENLLRNRQSNCSGSDGELHKYMYPNTSPSLRIDAEQERRPRAVSEILPPISLPPIFKVDENSKVTGKLNSGKTRVLVTGGRKISVPGKIPSKALIGQTHSGARKTPKDNSSTITDDKTMNYELGECRYLRTKNLED